MTSRLRLLGSAGLLAAALAFVTPAVAASIAFEFNVDGVLPSAQGAAFYGFSTETAALSVSGGILHQNTIVAPDSAGYKVAGVFDHSAAATLEWRAKVIDVTTFGLSIQTLVVDDGLQWNFFMKPDGVYIYDGTGFPQIVAMTTTDALHTYRAEIPAVGSGFQLYIDNVLSFTGTAPTSADTSALYWGDTTPSAGDGSADWDFVRFTNDIGPVPAPPALACFVLGLIALRIVQRRR